MPDVARGAGRRPSRAAARRTGPGAHRAAHERRGRARRHHARRRSRWSPRSSWMKRSACSRCIAAQTAVAIERAWLVRRVEQKRRLEAIGEVAAGVAHELRNPLFGISSAAQLLRFRAREDPVVEKNVGRILREVERLNRMVTSLLDFGRPAAAHLAPGDPEARVGRRAGAASANVSRCRASTLRRTRARCIPMRCLIDAEQLKQVFLNILVNAVDATPAGSDLTLSSHILPNGAGAAASPTAARPSPRRCCRMSSSSSISTKPGGYRHRSRALPAHHRRAWWLDRDR